jgi:hypothetical protein
MSLAVFWFVEDGDAVLSFFENECGASVAF